MFETQHGADVIRRLLVDTIYHEHLSYFLVGPLVDFFARHGMELIAVEHLTTKGGSIRGYAQLAGGPHRPDGSVVTIAAQEAADGLDRPQSYRRFVDRLAQLRERMSAAVAAETKAGRRIAGYGASVGSVTLVNQFELGRVLDFIADDKPLTEALLGPGYRIPVVAPRRALCAAAGPGRDPGVALRRADHGQASPLHRRRRTVRGALAGLFHP